MFPKLSKTLLQDIARYIDENHIRFLETNCYSAAQDQTIMQRRHLDAQVCRQMRPCAPMAAPSLPSLEEIVKHTDAGFTETLLKLMDRSGKKDSEIYKKANISKQHFSKIRNNPDYKPTKPTAIAFALALELDLKETEDLIGRAGFALTRSSKFDLIIRYFIEQRNYNIVEINMALYEFDQCLLGS